MTNTKTQSKPFFDFSLENLKIAGIAIGLFLVATVLINFIPRGKKLVSCKIIDRQYRPSYWTYSTTCSKNGCQTNSYYHPEEWHLKLQHFDGHVVDMECNQTDYYQPNGKRINVYEYYGCIYNNIG